MLDEEEELSGQLACVRCLCYVFQMAKALHDALPEPDSDCYVYIMEMELIKPVSGPANPKNINIANPLDSEFCFGFLSKRKTPPVSPLL